MAGVLRIWQKPEKVKQWSEEKERAIQSWKAKDQYQVVSLSNINNINSFTGTRTGRTFSTKKSPVEATRELTSGCLYDSSSTTIRTFSYLGFLVNAGASARGDSCRVLRRQQVSEFTSSLKTFLAPCLGSCIFGEASEMTVLHWAHEAWMLRYRTSTTLLFLLQAGMNCLFGCQGLALGAPIPPSACKLSQGVE